MQTNAFQRFHASSQYRQFMVEYRGAVPGTIHNLHNNNAGGGTGGGDAADNIMSLISAGSSDWAGGPVSGIAALPVSQQPAYVFSRLQSQGGVISTGGQQGGHVVSMISAVREEVVSPSGGGSGGDRNGGQASPAKPLTFVHTTASGSSGGNGGGMPRSPPQGHPNHRIPLPLTAAAATVSDASLSSIPASTPVHSSHRIAGIIDGSNTSSNGIVYRVADTTTIIGMPSSPAGDPTAMAMTSPPLQMTSISRPAATAATSST